MPPDHPMTPPPAPMRAALLRHAPTEWNREGRIQGHRDSPLTPAGGALAEAWGRRLAGWDFQRMVASDLGRARATAARIDPDGRLPRTTDPRLREQDWGAWTGLRLSDIRRRFPRELARQEAQGWDFRPPGGESRREVADRGRTALLDMGARWPGQRVLVVTHEGLLKCLLYQLIHHQPVQGRATRVRPYHLHWLAVEGETLQLAELNALNLVPAEPRRRDKAPEGPAP